MSRKNNLEIINHNPFSKSGLFGLEKIYKKTISAASDSNLVRIIDGLSACLARANYEIYMRSKAKPSNTWGYPDWISNEVFGELKRIGFLDHGIQIGPKKEMLLLSEPYKLTRGKLKEIIRICEENNLYFEINPSIFPSIYRPNNTIPIIIRKLK